MSEVIDFNERKASNVLPSPKGMRLKVMRLCQNEQISLLELAKQIQAEPVMAARMIKIANVTNANVMNTGRRRPAVSVTALAG